MTGITHPEGCLCEGCVRARTFRPAPPRNYEAEFWEQERSVQALRKERGLNPDGSPKAAPLDMATPEMRAATGKAGYVRTLFVDADEKRRLLDWGADR